MRKFIASLLIAAILSLGASAFATDNEPLNDGGKPPETAEPCDYIDIPYKPVIQ